MIGLDPVWLAVGLVAFCRIGGALLLMPGIASARVPVRARLLIALALTMCISAMVEPLVRPAVTGIGDARLAWLVASETLLGGLLGLMGRLFFLALHFAAMLLASMVGLGGGADPGLESGEPSSPLADLVTLTALLAMLAGGLHIELIGVIAGSFAVIPPGNWPGAGPSLEQLSVVCGQAFRLALQIAAPFVLYGLLVNLMVGLASRMIPQLPMQFVAGPLVLAGGLVLLAILLLPMTEQHVAGMGRWLARL